MATYQELIEQYKSEIKKCEDRIQELRGMIKTEPRMGARDEMRVRIFWLQEEINDMWDSINMMKQYA